MTVPPSSSSPFDFGLSDSAEAGEQRFLSFSFSSVVAYGFSSALRGQGLTTWVEESCQ